MKTIILCEHQERNGVQYPGCGAKIVMVTLIPENLVRGTQRKKIPLDARPYDPACGVSPSHAVALGWGTCRPLRPGETPAPDEIPALTHFATCPHRRPLA
ncbi:hypothetical protein V5R04_15505 [Jonesiaceae bacterium BS-20]|uniref:Uncharacterized protein n=1 Tax=Jonesiaceae bacterium BS-20 TaxID=3120821 RepID=A0AAU7DWE9_9MICO